MIIVLNVKKSIDRIKSEYPNSVIVNVSSKAELPFLKLSPFFPHGGIPIPYTDGKYSESVEGIWQGLKVFDEFDIDVKKFSIKTMKGLKRPVQFFGKPLGHRKGVNGEIIGYLEARRLIYVPAYMWVLEHKIQNLINELYQIALTADLILLDYSINEDINDLSRPLSHAFLIKQRILAMDQNLLDKSFSFTRGNRDKKDSQIKLNFNES